METANVKAAAKRLDKLLGLEIPGLETEAAAIYKDVVRLKAAAQEAEQLLLRTSRVVEQKRARKSAAASLTKVIGLGLLDVILGSRQPTDQEIKKLVKLDLVDNDWGTWRLTEKGGRVAAMWHDLTRD